MKAGRFIVPLCVVLALAVAIDAYVSQDPGSPIDHLSMNQPTEADKETNIRRTLTTLLTGTGVHVGTLPAVDNHTYRELRVRWQSSAAIVENQLLKQPATGIVTLLAAEKKQGTLPRDRSLELSTNQILAIAVDEKGNLRWWKLLLDPRLVRAEVPVTSGEMRGEEYYLANVDFIIDYPDDPGIRELRLYHPHWTGKDFQLVLLSTLLVE